jgi:polysaccharide export outer membrane protein
MWATSRVSVLALVGALAVLCLAGAGCESQSSWAVPTPFQVAPRATVTMLPPRPIDDGPTGSVWRASSKSTSTEPTEEIARPVVPASLHGRPAAVTTVARQDELPRELSKVTMPPYRVEPPDVLLVNAVRVVPRSPYKIEPLDELTIKAPPAQVLPNEPIGGVYPVGPDGHVELGYSYGKVHVGGLTPEEAREAVRKHVADRQGIKAPAVAVTVDLMRSVQQVRGEHSVRMDGTVDLGVYGEAYVAGMTLPEAKKAVETQLGKKLLNPEVTVDLLAHGSKVYYVIYDGGNAGQQVLRVPIQGGETVLDAVSELRGLPGGSSKKRVWIARPGPGTVGYRQVFVVDWAAITEGAATATNYQVFPGDRVYVKVVEDGGAFHDGVMKMRASFEQLLSQ